MKDYFTKDELGLLYDAFRLARMHRESISDEDKLLKQYSNLERKLNKITPEEVRHIDYVSDNILD